MPTRDSSTVPSAIIVGGGLAGMAAAVALESAGACVTLLEARRSLGGRAGSFEEPQTGEELDNCQHVLLGCCTNLLDFYRRLGVEHLIRFDRTIHFLDRTGKQHDLWGVPRCPAPLNLAPSLLEFEALTWHERFRFSRAMTVMMKIGRRGRERFADMPFGQWLRAHHQSAELIRKFYDPILISALNEETNRVSAANAIQVFQDAMLANQSGYPMGVPACPLSQLYGKLPCRDVRLGARVAELLFTENAVDGVRLGSGEILKADAVILATNHHAVRKWITPERAKSDRRFDHLAKLESVPILGAHLWFDRPVMSISHAALIDGPLQWLFRKDAAGTALHGVISAARDWGDRPKEHCLALFEKQVRTLFADARTARLVRGTIVIEKRATFPPLPGIDRIRPNQAPDGGGIQNLFLAGDYTKTGWPATMEGAVRAGYLAAEKALASTASPVTFMKPDLAPDWPARLMGMRT